METSNEANAARRFSGVGISHREGGDRAIRGYLGRRQDAQESEHGTLRDEYAGEIAKQVQTADGGPAIWFRLPVSGRGGRREPPLKNKGEGSIYHILFRT